MRHPVLAPPVSYLLPPSSAFQFILITVLPPITAAACGRHLFFLGSASKFLARVVILPLTGPGRRLSTLSQLPACG